MVLFCWSSRSSLLVVPIYFAVSCGEFPNSHWKLTNRVLILSWTTVLHRTVHTFRSQTVICHYISSPFPVLACMFCLSKELGREGWLLLSIKWKNQLYTCASSLPLLTGILAISFNTPRLLSPVFYFHVLSWLCRKKQSRHSLYLCLNSVVQQSRLGSMRDEYRVLGSKCLYSGVCLNSKKQAFTLASIKLTVAACMRCLNITPRKKCSFI